MQKQNISFYEMVSSLNNSVIISIVAFLIAVVSSYAFSVTFSIKYFMLCAIFGCIYIFIPMSGCIFGPYKENSIYTYKTLVFLYEKKDELLLLFSEAFTQKYISNIEPFTGVHKNDIEQLWETRTKDLKEHIENLRELHEAFEYYNGNRHYQCQALTAIRELIEKKLGEKEYEQIAAKLQSSMS